MSLSYVTLTFINILRALSCFVKSFVVLEKASNLSNLICKSILRLIPSKIVTLTFLFGVARSTDALLHRNIRKYHPCQEPLTIYKMGTDMFPAIFFFHWLLPWMTSKHFLIHTYCNFCIGHGQTTALQLSFCRSIQY